MKVQASIAVVATAALASSAWATHGAPEEGFGNQTGGRFVGSVAWGGPRTAFNDPLFRTTMTKQSDGTVRFTTTVENRITAVGSRLRGESFGAGRLTQAGMFDTAFAGSGQQLYNPAAREADEAVDATLDAEGRILVALSAPSSIGSVRRVRVMRLLPDGTADTSFGDRGGAVTLGFVLASPQSIAVDSRGRIVVTGVDGCCSLSVYRLAPDGSLDTSFGRRGVAGGPYSESDSRFEPGDGIVLDDDRIFAAGVAARSGGDAGAPIAMLLKPDGSLDTSFDDDGKLRLPLADARYVDVTAVTQMTDGRFVMAGNIRRTAGLKPWVMRLRADGKLDGTFSGDGVTVFQGPANEDHRVEDVTVDAAARVIVGGSQAQRPLGPAVFALWRLTGSGAADASFDGNGQLTHDFPADTRATGEAIVRQPQGRLALVGRGSSGTLLVAAFHGDADTVAPRLRLLGLAASRRTILVGLSANEAMGVGIAATAVVGTRRRLVTVATGTTAFAARGKRALTLALTPAGRQELAHRRTALPLTLTATSTDAAGNIATVTATGMVRP